MKKIILALSLLAVLSGCKTKPFKGFLVCKEYIQGHMDNEQPHIQQEAAMYVPVVTPRIHEPEYIPSAWIFYVANKYGVRRFDVDSLTYTRHKVGERIVMGEK
ncbi:MAG: lipoprotein [Bacteroidaceae bacterium]|nr:lipoprotein [Bacteroidaceae bacterium]